MFKQTTMSSVFVIEKEMLVILVSGLLILICFMILERILLKKYRKQIKIRVHINGTRGKSSTTRLIAAALRPSFRTVAKTTGTLPRRILEDGTEEPIIRTGPANINEQIKTLIWAGKRRAEAIVLECMALRPEYQAICEREIIHANIAVITNIRADHLDVMGPSVEDVGWAISGMIPKNGIVITAEQNFSKLLNEACNQRNAKLIIISTKDIDEIPNSMMEKFSYFEHKDNVAITLKISDYLGLSRANTWRAMYAAQPDPGALVSFSVSAEEKEGSWIFVNALAANDPDSSLGIWNQATSSFMAQRFHIALFNLRDDRADRTIQMANLSMQLPSLRQIILFGNGTRLFLDCLKKKKCQLENVINLDDISAIEASIWLRKNLTVESLVIAMGNIGGQGFALVDQLKKFQINVKLKTITTEIKLESHLMEDSVYG
jgi:poly-gamma-glutamate synthase PgsB/CapB